MSANLAIQLENPDRHIYVAIKGGMIHPKTLLTRAIGHLGYRISRNGASHALSLYQAMAIALLSGSPTLTIAVVGANDGAINDPIYIR